MPLQRANREKHRTGGGIFLSCAAGRAGQLMHGDIPGRLPAPFFYPPVDQRPGNAEFFRDAGKMFLVEPGCRFDLVFASDQLPTGMICSKTHHERVLKWPGFTARGADFLTVIAVSSFTSRTMACLRFLCSSTNPAIRPDIPGGNRGERAGRIRLSRCTGTMMAGQTPGYLHGYSQREGPEEQIL